jgi:hypothetical protein
MKFIHKGLLDGKWFTLSLCEQMANIGSEVGRAISWRKKGDLKYSQEAFQRALDLIDLTLKDFRLRKRLKEVTRLREILCDYFAFDNLYKTTDEALEKYFYAFTFAARKDK